MTILLDTNVLGRLANPADPLHLSALHALTTARAKGFRPALVPQVIYEYWVVATRPTGQNGLGMSVEEATADVTQCIELFDLFRDERAIFDRWQNLVAEHQVVGKQAHDARLAAAMHRHGICHLMTFNDRDFSRFKDVVVVNPQDIDSLTLEQQ